MTTIQKIAGGVFVASFIYDQYNQLKLVKRCTKLMEERTDLLENLASKNEQISYLVHLLNEHDIQLSEFDLIALPNVTQVEIESESP